MLSSAFIYGGLTNSSLRLSDCHNLIFVLMSTGVQICKACVHYVFNSAVKIVVFSGMSCSWFLFGVHFIVFNFFSLSLS